MQIFKNPDKSEWNSLIQRAVFEKEKLDDVVLEIIENVRLNGDKALLDYTEKFDSVKLSNLTVTETEILEARRFIMNDLANAILLAKKNIEKFHAAQNVIEPSVETMPGVHCMRKNIPIEKVGLYIPGGSAPLFSTVLMLAVPAQLAGCSEIIICTPPDKNGNVHPAILRTAAICGVKKIFKLGGAQAIAAMTFGTETIPKVYKIFGPGNQFVTKAKEIVQQMGVAIDMPAGPSEVLVVADSTGVPEFVAADLLSQAEHGADSQAILLTDSLSFAEKTLKELSKQLSALPRKKIAEQALANSRCIILNSMEECFEFSNLYAPEHLIIASENAGDYVIKVRNAGSVFVGNYSCESAGDYASGTNHTLPTNGYARNYSGVSLDSFMKKISFQHISKQGINNIGKAIELMAETEELFGHKNAVSLRLKSILNV